MNKRKMKEERVRFYGDFDGRIQGIIDSLQEEIDKYGKDATLDQSTEYDYYSCSCGGGYPAWDIVYKREETDAEMNKRLKAAEKARKRRKVTKVKEAVAKEEKDRKELARLQKKYGED